MKSTNVPIPQAETETVLGALAMSLENFTPEVHKAATYVLENPADIGVSSIREIALKAQVKPNTVMRLARSVGFAGFEDFRRPFRADSRGPREFSGQGKMAPILSVGRQARWLVSGHGGGING